MSSGVQQTNLAEGTDSTRLVPVEPPIDDIRLTPWAYSFPWMPLQLHQYASMEKRAQGRVSHLVFGFNVIFWLYPHVISTLLANSKSEGH